MTSDSKERKETPITTGVLDYFPLAIAGVARVSFKGNQKHNPGQPLHWAREKSTDHADCIGRHLSDRGKINPESGELHELHIAWRALALAQIAEEERLSKKPSSLKERIENAEAGTMVEMTADELHRITLGAFQRPLEQQSMIPDKKRVYLAGPMRGCKDFNFPAFDKAKKAMEHRGYEVVSPADIDRKKGHTDNKGYAERDVGEILKCDMIYLLKGWTKSVGATAEFMLARWICLEILCEDGSTDPFGDFILDNYLFRLVSPTKGLI
jgi:hypothetical protein